MATDERRARAPAVTKTTTTTSTTTTVTVGFYERARERREKLAHPHGSLDDPEMDPQEAIAEAREHYIAVWTHSDVLADDELGEEPPEPARPRGR